MAVSKWMLNKIKGINYKKMDTIVDIIAKENNKSKLYIKFDIFRNFIKRGSGYTDYFRGNYINLQPEEKETFITTKQFYKMLQYLNDPRYEIILNDKIIFNEYFKKYIKREFINLRIASLTEFKKFINNKDVVFAKKPIGYGGHGVSKIIIKDWNVEKLYKELKNKGQFLVEEAIIQHRELNEINPNVVNSFRVVTLYKDGKTFLVNNALRVNQGNSEIIGCTDDLYFSLNEDGTISSNVIDDFGNIYTKHPLTGKNFKDVKISGVKEAFDICLKAHLEIPQMRYIGWDIAFSENGPELVEGNEYPGYGIIQFYKLHNKKTGHLKEIKDILNDEMDKIKL